MAMFAERIDRETPELDDEGVRMRFIGRRDGLDAELLAADGVGRGAHRGQRPDHPLRGLRLRRPGGDRGRGANLLGETEDEFRRHLYAPDMHDPDLLIRTSGERRISNYLLWQCAYSELVFRDELWPDFSRATLRGVAGGVRKPQAPLRSALSRGGPARARRTQSDLAARVLIAIPRRRCSRSSSWGRAGWCSRSASSRSAWSPWASSTR